MQNSTSPTLATYLSGLAALASLVGIPASSILTYLLTRPKQSADIHKTEAEAGKAKAETRQIDSAIMDRIYDRLDDYETRRREDSERITDLENDNFRLQFDGRQKDAKNASLQSEMDLLGFQLQRARAAGFLEDRPPHSPNPAAIPS